ncbi:MAG TPA: two-component regulator propeller domain-containing protein, partial [Bacteroidales bacterium]|nr:two-component regulator propeller domain-containing protein [Bacteroidales bacterium]
KLFLWRCLTFKQDSVIQAGNLLRFLFILMFSLYLSASVSGQKTSTHFQHYTTQDGLLQNMVDCIFQDSRGYMWFGTWNGLCRFDGYTFLGFKEENSSIGKLSNNFVHSICEDTEGNLWIGTDDGLNVYVYDEDRFLHYNVNSKIHSLNSGRVLSVITSKHGEIWAGTDKGAYELLLGGNSKQLDSVIYYPLDEGQDSAEIIVNSILEDQKNNVWLGTNNGLFSIDHKTGNVNVLRHITGEENSLLQNVIQSLFEDPDGNIWIGTEFGISRYDPDNNTFKNYQHTINDPNSLVHNFIMSITRDRNGNLIIGTLGGISIYNPVNDDFINYTHKLNSNSGLNNDFINCVYADKEGNTWIGTERGGVNKFNSAHISFEYYENEPGNKNSLSHNTINSVLEDANYLWIGTAGGGLNRYNKKSHRFKIYKYNSADPNSLSGDFITSLIRDKYGRLWVGTWGTGLNLLVNEGSANEKFKHFNPDPADPASLVDAYIATIIQDKSGDLWIGTGGGLNQYSMKKGEFTTCDAHIENHELRQIGCLAFDADSNLWIGTRNGLFEMPSLAGHPGRIRTNNYKINYYQHNPSDKNSLSGNYVISLLKDRKSNIWIGTYGFGLNKLVKSDNDISFIHYDQKNGLSNNIVYSILEDKNGYLWLTTDHGLSRFQRDSESFRNF